MSDLTRWHPKNVSGWCPADWTDERLYDEFYAFAEARIKELEAEVTKQKNAAILYLDNAREFAKRQVYNKYGARLRAADELADAVEEADAVYGNFERELVAYREASKIGNSPADAAEREVARLTRLLEDTRHELNAIREARRQENLRVIDLALELAQSKDPGYWSIADLIRAALDQPGHPDDVSCCGGACGCKT